MTATITQAVRDGLIVTHRNVIKIKRVPDLIVFSTIQPIMFVLLFAYVFGAEIDLPGVSYREFLMAGVFVQTVAFGSAFTAVGLAEDLQKGIIDRFRTLPMSRAAVLVGRTTSDLINNTFIVFVMSVCGYIVGWRIRSSVPEALAALAILLLFSYAISWISALIGLSVRSVEVANSAGFLWLFPVTFVSNAFVPTGNMPTVLRVVAEWNPVTATATVCRKLFGNMGDMPVTSWPDRHAIPLSIFYSLVITAIFIPLAVRKYRAAASR